MPKVQQGGLIKRGDMYYVAWRVDGRQRRKSLKTGNKKDARKLANAFMDEVHRARLLPAHTEEEAKQNCTPAEVWALHNKYLAPLQSPNTLTLRAVHWRQFLEEFEPDTMGSVSRKDVEDLKLRWMAKPKKAAKTINGFLTTMRMMYNFALDDHPKTQPGAIYNMHNPFAKIARVEDDAEDKRALTLDMVPRLMDAAEEAGQDLHFFVALGLYAGLRKAEIIAARWEWIDWESRNINIAASHGFKPKHGRKRTVPLRADLTSILTPAKAVEGYIIAPDKNPGERYRYEPRKAFKRVSEAAGVPWLTPHLLRHSFTSFLARGGVSLNKLADWLGHSHTDITEIYKHLQKYDADIERFGGQ